MVSYRVLRPGQRSQVWVGGPTLTEPELIFETDELLGHPADLDVEVRVVATADWTSPLLRYPLFGGQGTINVNGWAPNSTRFAFMAYPID